jgi:hypothetical protein
MAKKTNPAHKRSAGRGKSPAESDRPEIVHSSVYIPRPVHQKLREIAFVQERKVHDVIMEGIDAVLQRHGHPSVAKLTAGTSKGGR